VTRKRRSRKPEPDLADVQAKMAAAGAGVPHQPFDAEEFVRSFKDPRARPIQARAKARAAEFQAGYVSGHLAADLRRLAAERARRRVEALGLYEPLPPGRAFHASRAQIRLALGSNRSGKTWAAASEVAMAVLGLDPHGKYPRRDGRFFAVGKDLRHVGQVMYRKLFKSEMKVIRDKDTGAWRAFRPWEAEDQARIDSVKLAPPLIPERYVIDVAWENKKENVPSVVKLATGWELVFFSSLGKPPNGVDINGAWFDEEIVDPEWLSECLARLLDRRGLLIWSATPQAGTDQLYDLHERAGKDLRLPPERRQVEEFKFLLANNPHVDEEQKRKFAANLNEDDHKVRVEGEFAVVGYRIYPEFSENLHGVDYLDVPADWTRYAYVDPGHQVCAVLFAAVPPPGTPWGDSVLLYDELYLKGCNAVVFAQAMARKAAGVTFQEFLMDAHMAIHTELGTGKTVMQQYAEELRKLNVSSRGSGPGFRLTSDDVDAGIMAVHTLLRARDDAPPRLRFVRQTMPNFLFEIKRYHKKRVGGLVQDKPDQRKDNHLMDCLRYMAMHEPRWVPDRKPKERPHGAYAALQSKLAASSEGRGGPRMVFGPGASVGG
jgi:hypothetical protein